MEKELTLYDDATSKEVQISGSFDKKEKKALDGYAKEVKQLRETNFFKQSMPAKLRIDWKEGKNPEFSTELPSNSDVGDLLMALRPLILQDEFCSFEKIAGFLGKNLRHEFIWQMLKLIREQYEGKKLQSLINIESHSLSLISEKFLFKWLNAYKYHRDLSKQKDLEPIFEVFPHNSVNAICTFLLSEKILAIIELDEIVSIILGDKKEIRTYRKN